MYCHIAKEGQTLAKMSSFTQHLREYFHLFLTQTAKQALFSHNLFNLSKTPT